MNLVDSCGWMEYLADGENADFFAPALMETAKLLVPTLCLFEVFRKVLRERGEDAALQAAALMLQGKIVDLDADLALRGARLSCDHHLPLADSLILATAQANRATLWTQDDHFRDIPGVRFPPPAS